MDFWRVTSPDYATDYESEWINGSLDHPYGLPGVVCDVCGETWGASRVLPVACPEQLRSVKTITERWPIPRSDHLALQAELMHAASIVGTPFVDLKPGDRLQPCTLDVPTKPCVSFLWCALGVLVVAKPIRDLLVDLCPQDIAVHPVLLGRIGDHDASDPPVIPASGEPEDILNSVRLLPDRLGIDPYFEIWPRGQSKHLPGREVRSVCAGCQRPHIEKTTWRIRMTRDMWQGQDCFFLADSLWVVVTDKIKAAIELLHPTNVRFVSLQ